MSEKSQTDLPNEVEIPKGLVDQIENIAKEKKAEQRKERAVAGKCEEKLP